MSDAARARLFAALDEQVLIDPHTHINPHAPAATTLADILGYHYYTELAHSAGLPRETIEQPGLAPKEKVGRLVERLADLDNTVQFSWLLEMAGTLFDVELDRLTPDNWEAFYDTAAAKMAGPGWEAEVLRRSRVETIFLTNEFDDPLTGFDTSRYVPCLRTDDLVFKLHTPEVRARLAKVTGIEVGDADSVRAAVRKLFEHFVAKGAKACAISLPPDFVPLDIHAQWPQADAIIEIAFGNAAARQRALIGEDDETDEDAWAYDESMLDDMASDALSRFVFWTLAEHCREFGLPFDLMIGVNRNVYPAGVHQGRDLYDSQCSLIQYADLFNAFPEVTFPVSVLAPTLNQELVSYAWIFPNVVTCGHWWYANIPAHIAPDLRARLQAVPRTKQVGYYSDAYKLEFIQPKFAMYKRLLSGVLLEDFVIGRGWSEQRAVDLGRQLLRGNVERIFKIG